MNNGVANLLGELTRRGVRLEPRGDALAFFPRTKVPRELRQRLQEHKPQLLQLLRGEEMIGTEPEAVPTLAAPTPPVAPPLPPYCAAIVDPDPKTVDALLLSIVAQEPRPTEILLVTKSQRGLRNAARQYGARFARSPLAATGEYVALIDGRTILTRDWVASALRVAHDAAIGAVYSDHQLLGTGGKTAYAPEVTNDMLAVSGLAAPTILVRRSALVPAWELGTTLQALLRRLTSLGWRVVRQDAPVLFRGEPRRTYFDRQELAHEPVTLFIPLSGREHIWPELRGFLERQTWPRDQMRLVLCDTSRDGKFSRTVRAWLSRCDYADTRWFRCPLPELGIADAPREQQLLAVNEAMCRLYNRLRETIETVYVWVLEDDIIPPDDVVERLLKVFDEDVATVSAPYRSRFDGRYLVWSRERAGRGGVHQLSAPLPDRPQVQDIRGSGFGCLMARTEALRKHVFHLPPGETHYDVGFFRELAPRWKRRVDWTCKCRHLHNVPQPAASITTRHLIYHVAPFAANDVWLRNIRQILRRIDLFNGRRVIAVATGDEMVSPQEVRAAFGTHEVEILTRPNSRELRDNATFLPLLERVADANPHTATFYAHAKGVWKDQLGTRDQRATRYWRNAMYHELLDDWPRIAELLVEHAVIGTHRRDHRHNVRIYPDGQSESPWHFAGTYFWFRNADAFATAKWKEVWQSTGWGAEAWPGRMFDYDLSACVAYDELPAEACYTPDAYEPQIEDITD